MSASRAQHHHRARARRLSRVGLAGLAGVLVTSPLAYADTPTPEATPTVSTTQASTPPTPSVGPGTTVPSATAAPLTDAGSLSPAGTSTSGGPASAEPTATSTAVSVTPTNRPSASADEVTLEADYGLTKIRVGARVAPGSTPPDGVTTVGSVLHVAPVVGLPGTTDTDCTTQGPPDGAGVTYCPEQILVSTQDSVSVTQLSAPDGLRVDPGARIGEPIPCRVGEFCYGTDVVFDDPAVDAPTAVDDSVDATSGRGADLDLVANDQLYDRDVTGLTTTAPAHGTAKVVDATTGAVRYTADAGYAGADIFTYTVVTAAGSSTATVTVEVRPAPTAPTTTSSSSDSADGDSGSGGSDDGGGRGTTLAATGAPSAGGPLGTLGTVLSSVGAVLLLRRRRPRGTHV